MEDKHLDRIFREKLEQVQPQFDTESWELLEQKMDGGGFSASEADDQFIDEKVFNKLHRLEVDYQPSHWNKMATLLDEEFFYHQKVIRYKAMELAMLFLLVFALAQYLPYPNSDQLNTAPAGDQIQNNINTNSSTPTHEETNTIDQIQAGITPNNLLEESTSNSTTSSIAFSSDVPVSTTESPSRVDLKEESSIIDLVAGENLIESQELPISIIPPLNTLNFQQFERQAESAAYLRSLIYKAMSSTSYYRNNETGLLASLENKEIDPLQYEVENLVIKERKPKNHIRIGIFGSLDYNRVLTPPNEVENITGFERYALGYGGGISVGFEFGRFEVESGFIYSAKQYKAVPVLFVQGSVRDGYFAEGVKDIELNMINIPVNLRYNVLVKNKLRLYALTGLSLQMAYQANYYTANQDGFHTNNFLPAPAPLSPPEGTPEILEDSLNKGLFEGGSFSKNSYLTGNFGLGLDYYFTTRWSFFAQPTYQHSINYFIDGIGPLHDRINTFSIYTGIKVKL